jgi:hypothetical protein
VRIHRIPWKIYFVKLRKNNVTNHKRNSWVSNISSAAGGKVVEDLACFCGKSQWAFSLPRGNIKVFIKKQRKRFEQNTCRKYRKEKIKSEWWIFPCQWSQLIFSSVINTRTNWVGEGWGEGGGCRKSISTRLRRRMRILCALVTGPLNLYRMQPINAEHLWKRILCHGQIVLKVFYLCFFITRTRVVS